MLSSLELEGVGEFLVEVAVGNRTLWGKGNVEGRERALGEMLCPLLVDLVDCLLAETALSVSAFWFEVLLTEGAMIVVVSSCLAWDMGFHLQLFGMC